MDNDAVTMDTLNIEYLVQYDDDYGCHMLQPQNDDSIKLMSYAVPWYMLELLPMSEQYALLNSVTGFGGDVDDTMKQMMSCGATLFVRDEDYWMLLQKAGDVLTPKDKMIQCIAENLIHTIQMSEHSTQQVVDNLIELVDIDNKQIGWKRWLLASHDKQSYYNDLEQQIKGEYWNIVASIADKFLDELYSEYDELDEFNTHQENMVREAIVMLLCHGFIIAREYYGKQRQWGIQQVYLRIEESADKVFDMIQLRDDALDFSMEVEVNREWQVKVKAVL